VIFDAASRAASPRSRCIIEKLQELTLAPEAGKLLDIGCGNGAMLRSFSEVFPRWQLAGSELSDRFRDQVLSIPRVAEFYSGPLAAIETEVDLISMLHVLEHVENPVQALADAARLLRPGGRILIQVPNLVENPFDLLVADHCSHFVPQVLLNVVHRAGLVPVAWSTSWVTKEISVVAGLACDSTADCGDVREPIDVDTNCELVAGHVRWLHDLVERGRSLAKQRAVGIFGTSIAGTWMGAELGAGAKFFVDEDQSRIGGRHLALPIVSVAEVPRDSAVLIVLPPAIASRVQQRVQPGRVDAQFVAPPLLHAA
jgi:SAM-dependent methyltransferase